MTTRIGCAHHKLQTNGESLVLSHREIAGRPPLRRRVQRGLGIGAAIFLIMVVALLSAAIVRTVQTGAESHALEVMAHRAFLVAQSGAQLGLHRVLPPAGLANCAAQTYTFASLEQSYCSATVSCTQVNAQGRDLYTITSRGTCMDGATPVAERVVEVQARSG